MVLHKLLILLFLILISNIHQYLASLIFNKINLTEYDNYVYKNKFKIFDKIGLDQKLCLVAQKLAINMSNETDIYPVEIRKKNHYVLFIAQKIIAFNLGRKSKAVII